MQSILATFLTTIQSSQKILIDAHQTGASGTYLRSQDERELITGACFVRKFIALEEYFEAAFGHYATGGSSITGWTPQVYASPPTLEHAHKMMIGLKPFMDWSTPDQVTRLANLYFASGEPFVTAISSAQSDLRDMKTVRNGTAHVSRTTASALEGLYSRWTGAPKQGVSAYEMIMAPNNSSGSSFESYTTAIVTAVANQVAHYS